ncbi:MATE family efflux transporter [Salimicrobium halophilum]|uniref:Probable multidrug resistance protein NorM n=1 Tax=Salimicrobium halophilum TaxID=86666 RepID=A0A1G8TJI2_9BACI|nr:MATE family efflux transporter [Salimicrobium halophilum]SDJ41681.1 multidrug resistance protein, MATE family [Salimicrobium halophilum]
MYPTQTNKEKIKLLFHLLLPILITQVGMYAMNFFDTVMAGQFGAQDLAGVAVGSNLWMPVFTFFNGVIIAISPIVSQLKGKGEEAGISSSIKQGLYLSLILALLLSLIGYSVLETVLGWFSLEAEVRHIAYYYLIALGTGIIPLFLFNLLRSFIDALGKTRISMMIILMTVPLNFLFNYLLIFGKGPIPALGGIGAGIATSLTYWTALFIAFICIQTISSLQSYRVFRDWHRPSLPHFKEQLQIGVPIGLAIFFETSIFAAVTLFMTVYNTTIIAAHQAAMNFASLLYMIPLSISFALTIAVAYEAGAGRHKEARTYSWIGITGAILLSVFAGLILYVLDDQIAALYSNDDKVMEWTKNFLFLAIFYQLSDAIGAPIQGVLRGYKDVNITLVMAFVSFWIIGLPSGYLLANYTTLGPYGYWMSLIIGLTVGAIVLLLRMIRLQSKTNY